MQLVVADHHAASHSVCVCVCECVQLLEAAACVCSVTYTALQLNHLATSWHLVAAASYL